MALVHYWQSEQEGSGNLYLPGDNQFVPEDLQVLELPVSASNIPVEVPIDGKHEGALRLKHVIIKWHPHTW